MSYVPLWQLAEELGCVNAIALVVEPRFRQELGNLFYLDGQPIYLNFDTGDSTTILFEAFDGLRYNVKRLDSHIANRLTVNHTTYLRFFPNHTDERVGDNNESMAEPKEPIISSTGIVVALTATLAAALVIYKSGWFDSSDTKKTTKK